MTLDACGLEELDGVAMAAVSGGLSGFGDLIWDAAKALAICLVTSSDSLIEGARAGWAAA